jgi:uncharacterized protein (TIGR02145 family)
MPDGKWWFAEDLAFVPTTQYYISKTGFLYRMDNSPSPEGLPELIPPGCRVPAASEWKALNSLIASAGISIRSATGWNSNLPQSVDAYKFNAKPSGVYNGTSLLFQGRYAAWWIDLQDVAYIANDSSAISIFGGELATNYHALRFIVESGNTPDSGSIPDTFLPEYHLPEQITLEPISVHNQFKAYSGTVRTLNGSGGTYFVANSTYKMELTSEEYTAFDEWWRNSIHYGQDPFQIPNFPLGKVGMAVQLIALPSVTQTHSGYSVSLKAQFKSSDTIGGIYNTTCPFKLLELSGNQFQVSQAFIATGGVSTVRATLNRRGIQMSLGFIGNGDEMAQLIEWFRFGIGNGSKMFKASTDSKINWLWKLTSMPKFTMKGALGSATFEVLGRAP